jgi:oligoribonuclease NrnB/cAMP/cGMP phosphodiesterase (DHH superfamily)
VFDKSRSGAGIAWDHFCPGTGRPYLIEYVEDRDLWKLDHPSAEATHEYLVLNEKTVNNWNRIHLALESKESRNNILDTGHALVKYRENVIDGILKNNKMELLIDGQKGLGANCPGVFASNAGHLLANESGTFGCTWEELSNRKIKFSLRSNGEYDVANIAEKFGGGGHKNAAGFVLETFASGAATHLMSAGYRSCNSISPDTLFVEGEGHD